MEISIRLKDRREIITNLTQEEYDGLKKLLMGTNVKRVEIENHIIDVNSILLIEPIKQDPISKEFRLKQPEFKSIDTAGRMKELWNLLKGKGLFERVSSYDEFRNRKGY